MLEAGSPGQLAANSSGDGGSGGTAGQGQAQPEATGVPPSVQNATELAPAGSSTSSGGQEQPGPAQAAPSSLAARESSSSSLSLGGAQEGRVDEMLSRLQALPWRRVDVCFGATLLPMLSHQHIQASHGWRAVGPLAVRSSSTPSPCFYRCAVNKFHPALACTHVVLLALPAGAAALDELAWESSNQAPGAAAASHGGTAAAGAAGAASATAATDFAAAASRAQHCTNVGDEHAN